MMGQQLNTIELLARLESLEKEFDTLKTSEVLVETPTWEVPSYSSSWVDYDAGHAVGYAVANGKVYLKGWMKDGALTTAAFTLPSGYRPSQSFRFPVYTYSGGTVLIGTLRLDADGSVTPNTGYTDIFSIDNIAFWGDGS